MKRKKASRQFTECPHCKKPVPSTLDLMIHDHPEWRLYTGTLMLNPTISCMDCVKKHEAINQSKIQAAYAAGFKVELLPDNSGLSSYNKDHTEHYYDKTWQVVDPDGNSVHNGSWFEDVQRYYLVRAYEDYIATR